MQAQFPPYVKARSATLRAFHEPIQLRTNAVLYHPPFFYHCPIAVPDGQRFAILFSGMSNVRHVNNLEFMYRMLVDDYAFDEANICVLNYDGSLNYRTGPRLPGWEMARRSV